VKPTEPAYICVVLATGGSGEEPVRLRLLVPETPESPSVLTNTLTQFPKGEGAHSLPAGTETAVFLAVASAGPVPGAKVADSLAQIARQLTQSGHSLGPIPRGQTLWYGHTEDRWMGGGSPAAGENIAALDLLCDKVRGLFKGARVGLCAAATSCSPN
jgi:hypothetical protein